jgi:predicted aminopeptidase
MWTHPSPNIRRALRSAALIVATLISIGGCSALSYYGQAVSGQLYILTHRQDIDRMLEDPATDPQLRTRLDEIAAIRRFAVDELALPLEAQFSTYVDLGRPYVVWNVFAAAEFSVQPRSWCYPVAGCVSYRGYFDEAKARAFAKNLREKEGLDVYVGGIAAYSTLGWFSDPVLNTVMNRREHQLAALIFHELAHQVAYAKGDTEFNESFATAVEREGQRRWLQARADAATREELEASIASELRRQQQFVALVQRTVADLDVIYRSGRAVGDMRAAKAARLDRMRADYAMLKEDWGGYAGYDTWFAAGLNNAQLATVATYNGLEPAFAAMLARYDGDLPTFYARARELAQRSSTERRAILQSFLEPALGSAPSP